MLAVLLAVALGGIAGTEVGAKAGAFTALAGVVASAVLAIAVDRQVKRADRMKQQRETLRKFAPPRPMCGEEDED
jgi:outer membrane lipoprotein SlyB